MGAIHFQPIVPLDPEVATFKAKLIPIAGNIIRIDLEYQVSGPPWLSFGELSMMDPETGDPISPSPDEIINEVMAQCDNFASESGGSHFRANCIVIEGRGKKEKIRAQHTFRRGKSATVNEKDGEMIALVREMRDTITSAHKITLDMAGKTIESVTAFIGVQNASAEMVKANSGNASALVDMARLKYDFDRDMAEAQADQEKLFKGMELIEHVATQWLMGGGQGAVPTPGKEPIPGTLDGILKSLDKEELEKLGKVLGDDAWALFKGAAAVASDDEARAVLEKLKELWRPMGKEEGGKLMASVGQILGQQRFAQLVIVLKKAGLT